jgi:hypothetical protein
MPKQNEILPLEYSRAAERLDPISENLRKHDERQGSTAYDVEFVHPDEANVSAHLIHKESGSSVGFLSWNHTTGASLINVSPAHTGGGLGAARLITSSWKYAHMAGIGGPTDSALQTVAGWSLQNKLHPEGSGFRSHPWSVPEGTPPKKIDFRNEPQEVDPQFKGERTESAAEFPSSAIQTRWSSDQTAAQERAGRDAVLTNLVHRNILLAKSESRRDGAPASSSQQAEPRRAGGPCTTCGNTGKVSVIAWHVGADQLRRQVNENDEYQGTWEWHYPNGETAGDISPLDLVDRMASGRPYTIRDVQANEGGRQGGEIEFDCPTCLGRSN